MKFRKRPLLVDTLDADLYVSRPALEFALRDAIGERRNTLVVGGSGTGKTTLLRKVAADTRAGRTIGWVNASLARDVGDLIALIARALGAQPNGPQVTTASSAVELLQALEQIPREPEALIILDGLADAGAAYTLFGRLREELWALPHTWIVAAGPDVGGTLRTPPAHAFWSLTLELPEMTHDEVEELLQRGLDPSELTLIQADSQTPPHDTPRHVIHWAEDVLAGGLNGDRTAEFDGIAERLGHPASRLLAELQALDRPASAGDPELLARTGWTRAYVSRWLNRMEAAGVLRSFAAATDKQGRPPKVFEPGPEP